MNGATASDDCLNVITTHSRRGKRWFIFYV